MKDKIMNCLNQAPAFVPEDAEEKKVKVLDTFKRMGYDGRIGDLTIGRTYTLIEFIPKCGTQLSKIQSQSDDIDIAFCGSGVRVIVPIPGKDAIGVEFPNNNPSEVRLRGVLQSETFGGSDAALPVAIGMDVYGNSIVADLAKMPHLLIGGATGQGKSVFLNSLIASLLYATTPEELQLVLIDPKMVEFSQYRPLSDTYLQKFEGIEEPIITDTDDAIKALDALCDEMDRRYSLLKEADTRSISEYNEESDKKMHYIVVVIDEYADLILTHGEKAETYIARLAQKARAVGIHLVLSTQRPSTNVITGIIKANFPARLSFKVASFDDSLTMLDREGAQQLIGRGDALFSNNGVCLRLQTPYVDFQEIEKIVTAIADEDSEPAKHAVLPSPSAEESAISNERVEEDPLYREAVLFISHSETASTSSLQRRFGIGYKQAGKLIDRMEAEGFVGPSCGAKPREVFINPSDIEIRIKPRSTDVGKRKWQNCLQQIRTEVTPGNYAWFDGIYFDSFTNGTLTLGVPSEWYVNVLEEKFINVLGAAIRRHFGPETKLIYKFPPTK